ncbi:hypothetical protein Barb6XT_00210 [Bacteroidales bacterium Barb6XT]|nr:hypothetical protein Barb6XT_00210 [Bacteroidales bacterium Barb6XT]
MNDTNVLLFEALTEGTTTEFLALGFGTALPGALAVTATITALATTLASAEAVIAFQAAYHAWFVAPYVLLPYSEYMNFNMASWVAVRAAHANLAAVNMATSATISAVAGVSAVIMVLSFIALAIVTAIFQWKNEKENYTIRPMTATIYRHETFGEIKTAVWPTIGTSFWDQEIEPHYYSVKEIKKGFNLADFQRDARFNNVFYIEKEVFKNVKGVRSFKYPPHLNYIGDRAFAGSDLEEFDCTQGKFLAVIGAEAFKDTRVSAIDLSEHYALGSVGDRAFAGNSSLHTLKLPMSLVGIGSGIVDDTPNLREMELGWATKQQLELIEKNFRENKGGRLNDFAGKKLLIPPGSFDQYYRHNKNCKFLEGNFLIEENHPVVEVVETETVLKAGEKSKRTLLTRDGQLKAIMDAMKFESKEEDKNKRQEEAYEYYRGYDILDKEYNRSDNADRNSGTLYNVDVLRKKAGLLSIPIRKRSRELTLDTDKINYDGEDFELEYFLLPEETKSVLVTVANVRDSLLSKVGGNHPSFTFADNIKTIGKGVFGYNDSVDVYFDWLKTEASVSDRAFGKNVRLHTRNYNGKREDFTYFNFNADRYSGGLIMPLEGMTEEEVSQRTVDGITYEFVKPDTSRVVKVVGKHINLSEKKEIGGNRFSLSDFERLEFFRGNRTIQTVQLPAEITSLPAGTFSSCSDLEAVEGMVTSVGASAFSGCSNLQAIPFGQQLVSIGDYAFSDCRSLKALEIPASVKRIGDYAFSDCLSLTSLEMPASVEWIGKRAFEGTGLTSLTLPATPIPPAAIAADAFAGVPASCEVHIPRGAEENYGYTGNETGNMFWQGLSIVPNYYDLAAGETDTKRGIVNSRSYEFENGNLSYGTMMTLTAYPVRGYHFAKWINAAGDSISAGNPYSFVVKNDAIVRAYFAPNSYSVDLSAAGGAIKSGGGLYAYDTEATAEASATEEDTRFVKWTDAGGKTLSTDNPFTFVVKGDAAVRAHFEAYAFSEIINGTVYNLDVDRYTAAISSTNRAHNVFAALAIPSEVRTAAGQRYAVTAVGVEAFRGNGRLQSVTVPNSLTGIERGAFSACANLQDVELEWDSPDRGRVDADAFAGVAASCRVHIPKGSEERYGYDGDLKAVWQGLPVVSDHYAVRAKSNDAAAGHVTGGGERMVLYAETTLTADADSGYHFVKWANAKGDSVSARNPYRFLLAGDTELTAVFAAGDGDEAEDGVVQEPQTGSEKDGADGGATHALPVLKGEAGVYYTEGVLRLVNLKGAVVSVSTMKGKKVLQFTADDAEYPVTLPAGVYILNAAKGRERIVATKFVVK